MSAMAAVVDLRAQGFLSTGGGSELSAHLLEAIEHEADAELERHAAAVRFEGERHDEAMRALTDMRRLAEALNGPQPVALPAPEVVEGEAEEVPAIDPPPPEPPAAIPIAGRGPAAARAREERVIEALRAAGKAIAPQLADATALTVPQVRGALRRLESQVPPLARPTGEKIGISRNGGGRPSEVWEPVDPETEPEADDAEDLLDDPEVLFSMQAPEARAVWHAIATAVTLLEQLGPDVPPHAPLFGQHEVLAAAARRLDHEINHAPACEGVSRG